VSSLKRRIGMTLMSFGADPRRVFSSLRFVPGYLADLICWSRSASRGDTREFPLRLLPTLADKYATSGVASGHYFHQDLWAARLIHAHSPKRHVDVGSRIDGFIAHLLCFRSVEVLDIRNLTSNVAGLTFRQADLMSEHAIAIDPAESVSCLHALEHFGLGRYGDAIRPSGWRVGLQRLAELVQPGGRLYLSVPIGRPAVEFNAQRIFHPGYIVCEAQMRGLQLQQFAYVDDAGNFNDWSDSMSPRELATLAQLEYGCGLFLFRKDPAARDFN
jgi:hypothetical protein